MRGFGGEIVRVEGGHVRSAGRKDRHSKVYTAKGPRDRRVRLSAHTAIQFYDVQDRLGYDRPSKAVDWLIRHAKTAIDKLAPRGTGTGNINNDSVYPDGIGSKINQEDSGTVKMVPRKDVEMSLQSSNVGSVSPAGIRFESCENYQQVGLGGYGFLQQPFGFCGHHVIGPDGFPGLCVAGQILHEECSEISGLQYRGGDMF